jgi:hypothetical protein
VTTFGLAGRRAPFNAPAVFLAGILITIAETLLHPTIVLVFFASELTDSLRTIGYVVTVGLLGWYLPQVLAPWLTGGSGRQLPWALGASIIRSASAIFLAYSAYRTDVTDDQRLRSFFICYGAYSLASGFVQLPMSELISRSVPGQHRERLIQQRNLWGGLLAIGVALFVRHTLGTAGPGFPRNVALLYIAAAAAVSGATYFIARIREPQLVQRSSATGSPPSAGDVAKVLSDGAFRRFHFFGLLCTATTVADPFYVAYARSEYHVPSAWVGMMLVLFAAGSLLSAPMWAGVIRFGGARAALQTATAIKVVAPLLVVALPYLIDSDLYRDHVSDRRVVYSILAAPFAVLGIATRGYLSGNFRYLMDLTVSKRRSSYQIVALTPLLVAAAIPLAGAEIAGRWGFDRLFLSALFTGFVAVVCAGALAGTSRRVRATSAAWRLRDAGS